MTFQERLSALSQYDVRINTHNGNFVVSVRFKEDWVTVPPPEGNVRLVEDDSDQSLHHYVTPINGNVDDIFDLIEETIAYNRELEDKVLLFNDRIRELKDIFAGEPLAKLKRLRFVFEREKKSKKKQKEAVSEPIQEESEPIVQPDGEMLPEEAEMPSNEVEAGELSDIDRRIMGTIAKGGNK